MFCRYPIISFDLGLKRLQSSEPFTLLPLGQKQNISFKVCAFLLSLDNDDRFHYVDSIIEWIRLSRRSEMNLFIICLSTFYKERKLVWKTVHGSITASWSSCLLYGSRWSAWKACSHSGRSVTCPPPECCFSQALCKVHRICQESARSKSALESSEALLNQLLLAEDLFS